MEAVPTSAQLIEAWRRIVLGDSKSWVLFSHGTCVIIMQPKADLRAQAVELMREYGPVHVGSPAGDFSVITLTGHPGWAVTCHHDDILTYVAPEELSADKRGDAMIGLFGRDKRDRDASELEVIHVEINAMPPNHAMEPTAPFWDACFVASRTRAWCVAT